MAREGAAPYAWRYLCNDAGTEYHKPRIDASGFGTISTAPTTSPTRIFAKGGGTASTTTESSPDIVGGTANATSPSAFVLDAATVTPARFSANPRLLTG